MPTQHTTAADAAQPAARPHHARIDWSPFLNTTGRLLMLLTQLDGDLPSVRDLARRLGCSIGAVSGGLRELEGDGYLVRDGRSFTLLNMGVQSAEHVQETEQAVQETEQAAAPADRVPTPTATGGVQLSEQSVQNSEPPHTPHNGTLAASSSSYRAPLENELRAAGVYPALARKIARRHPDRTIAEFESDVALAEQQGKTTPVPYVATLWADGDRVREVSYGRSDLPPADRGRSAAADPRDRPRRGPAEPGPARNFADLVW